MTDTSSDKEFKKLVENADSDLLAFGYILTKFGEAYSVWKVSSDKRDQTIVEDYVRRMQKIIVKIIEERDAANIKNTILLSMHNGTKPAQNKQDKKSTIIQGPWTGTKSAEPTVNADQSEPYWRDQDTKDV